MQLSKKPKTFSEIFIAFLKFLSRFNSFAEKDGSHSLSISEINYSERGAYLKFSMDPLQNIRRQSTW